MLQVHTSYLRKLRRNCHLSMAKAAKILGIGKATLSRYERGATKVKADILLRMADAYHVQIQELLKEVKNDNI